ncbi:MAG: response regulator, partial [Cyanobacteriota bacterium]|nr:response regulator [Cyanobacteriota bacterium]
MRILFVEDDHRLCALLVPTLLEQRYTVDVARHPQKALTLLANAAYDLLLLDVVLPEIDGITLCRQLRELGSDIPILLLTA